MEYNLNKLTEEEINIILLGLSELPYKISYMLIDKITNQCNNKIEKEYDK